VASIQRDSNVATERVSFLLSWIEQHRMTSQFERAAKFRLLHQGPLTVVVANVFDAGSAKLVAALGFDALATTSAGLAFHLGRRDGKKEVSRDDALQNCREIAASTALPVSADLENCFADDPRGAARTIELSAQAGVVGGSIEDASGEPASPIYDFSLAVERVHAAVEAARALDFPFTLTARAENFLHGKRDLDDTIRRLQAFEQAGADVLFAPGLPNVEAIRTVVNAVSRPLNVLVSSGNSHLTVAELAALGVKRVSIGGVLSRVAFTALATAAREIRQHGTFTCADGLLSMAELEQLFAPRN
jgi:2-methylisocitrate lyase-like PEP mutase family enzyme